MFTASSNEDLSRVVHAPRRIDRRHPQEVSEDSGGDSSFLDNEPLILGSAAGMRVYFFFLYLPTNFRIKLYFRCYHIIRFYRKIRCRTRKIK